MVGSGFKGVAVSVVFYLCSYQCCYSYLMSDRTVSALALVEETQRLIGGSLHPSVSADGETD